MPAIDISIAKRPGGRLDPAWFRAGDLDDRLTAYLTETGVTSETDEVQVAHLYRRAFRGLADDLLAQPASQTLGPKSSRFEAWQLDHFQQQAAYWEAAYARLKGGLAIAGVTR